MAPRLFVDTARVRRTMAEQGVDLPELARRLGVGELHLQKVVGGEYAAGTATITKIAAALGVEPSRICMP